MLDWTVDWTLECKLCDKISSHSYKISGDSLIIISSDEVAAQVVHARTHSFLEFHLKSCSDLG